MSEITQNLYTILQVHPKAEADTITHVYRFLARKYHPDTAPQNEKASYEERMKSINAAYETLSNPNIREQYDATSTSEIDLETYPYKFQLAAKLSEVGSAGGNASLCYAQSCEILAGIAANNDNSMPVRCEALARQADIQVKGLQQYSAASETYLKLLDTATDADRETKDDLLWRITECYAEAKSFEKAVKAVERLISETPDPTRLEQSELVRAAMLHRAQRHQDAVTAYQQYAKKYSGTSPAAHSLFMAARILDSELSRWQEAIAAYKHVTTEYAQSEEAGDCQWRIAHIQRKHIEKKAWWE